MHKNSLKFIQKKKKNHIHCYPKNSWESVTTVNWWLNMVFQVPPPSFRGETQFINRYGYFGFHDVIGFYIFRLDAIFFFPFCCIYTLLESEATNEVIVCYPCYLHERVDDCGPHRAEPSSYKVLAYRICFGSFRRDLSRIPESANYRLVVHKAPNILVKWPKLINDLASTKPVKS